MLKATTLIEILTTLAVAVIGIYFLSPTIFRLQDPFSVQQEAENLRAFFHQIRSTARFQQQNYAISVAQNAQQWCAVAIAKNGTKAPACNCLQSDFCAINASYRLYRSQHGTEIKASNLFPAVLTHIDGTSGNNSGGCINIIKGKENQILQFQQAGVVNVIQSKTRSNCH